MLRYELSDFYWLYFYCLIFWLIALLAIKVIAWKIKSLRANGDAIVYLYFLAVTFSFLGITIGLLVGTSLSPVIGVVIPALLTFFGGFITYSFVFRNKSKKDGYVMLIILFSVSLFLTIGSDYGAKYRIAYELDQEESGELRKRNFEIFKYNMTKDIDHYEIPTPSSDSSDEAFNKDTIGKTEIKPKLK